MDQTDKNNVWRAGIERFSPFHLGLGAVFGSVFALFMLAGSINDVSEAGVSGGTFLLAFLFSDACANVLIAIAGRLKAFRLTKALALAGAMLMIVGFVVVGLVFVLGLDPTIGSCAGGVLAGIGNAPFVIMWGKIYGACTRNETIAYASLSFGIAALLKYALSMLASEPVVLLGAMVVLLVIAMGCQVACLEKDSPLPIFNLPEAQRSSSPRLALSLLWKPFWGVLLCSFVGGLTWGAAATGSSLVVSLLASLATLAVAGIGVASIFAFGGYFSFDNLPRVVLPVAVGVFLVLPFLEDSSTNAIGTALLTVPYSAVVLFFDVFAWAMLALACERSNMAAEVLFGAGRALQAAVMGIGILAYGTLGSAERILCLLITTAYLVALGVNTTKKGSHAGTEISTARSASPYESACSELAAAHGLSPRETDVLVHLGRGHSSTYIGKTLFLSGDTIKTHSKHIYRKFGVESREELIDYIAAREKQK